MSINLDCETAQQPTEPMKNKNKNIIPKSQIKDSDLHPRFAIRPLTWPQASALVDAKQGYDSEQFSSPLENANTREALIKRRLIKDVVVPADAKDPVTATVTVLGLKTLDVALFWLDRWRMLSRGSKRPLPVMRRRKRT